MEKFRANPGKVARLNALPSQLLMLQYNNATPNAAPSKSSSQQTQNPCMPADIQRTLSSIPMEEREGLLIFFEKATDQFEIYAEGADFMTTLQQRNQILKTSEGLSRCSYNQAQFRSSLKDLVGAQGWRRLEIWEFSQVRKTWKCAKSASPGNTEQLDAYFETNDGTSGDLSLVASPVVVALVIAGSRVGLAYADAVNLNFGITEFSENELMANVEVALIQLGAVECLVGSTMVGLEKIQEICKSREIALTALKAGQFSEDCQSDVTKLIRDEQFCVMEHPLLGLKAASGLISYLNLLGSDTNLKAFKFCHYNLDSYLKLDDTALRSLHVFNTASGPRSGSLYSLLNQCKTVQGARLLDQWLRQPLRSKDEIEARLDIVEACVECSGVRQSLRETGLRALPDLSRILKRLLRGSSNLQDIMVLYQAIEKIPFIIQELEGTSQSSKHEAVKSRYNDSFSFLKNQLGKFSEMIENMVDFDALERHEYIVRAEFDEYLQGISQQKEDILTQIEPEFARVARQLGLEANKKVKLERNNIYGYIFRVSRLDAATLKDEAEYQQLATQKNGVYFVTPLLRDLSLRYDELCKLYASKQSVLVKEMLATAASYRPVLDQLNLLIADLDVCLSLAYVSIMSPKSFVRPSIGGTDLVLKAARHPCIEAQVDFIANDAEFKRGPDGAAVQLITGPNMGGKSTYIRQAALIVILAQIGCFVPCDYASVPVFDSVMVRVGAGDSILKGISTFMAEMLETASILKTATKDSFVIIDELGRGTSTSEGLGLAWGVTKYIATKIGCFTFFATHFHELTVLATELPGLVKNLHVSAQVFQGQLTMLYAVRPGVCDQSFGIHVAELANFPSVVVKMARIRNAELEGLPLLKFSSDEEQAKTSQIIESTLAQLKELDCEDGRLLMASVIKNAPKPLQDLLL